MTSFNDKYSFLESEKIKELFNENKENKIEENKIEDENINLFKPTVLNYLSMINIFRNDIVKYDIFLDEIYPYYKAYLNYFENVFYSDGTTFHKQQQIDNIKNLILSLRLIFNDIIDFNKYEIVKYIKETLFNLTNNIDENRYLFDYQDSYMHYINLFEKIFLSLQILFNYEEMKETLKYIIYIFLPFFCFGFYIRKLIIEKKTNKINEEEFKQKLDLNKFKEYLENDNLYLMNYLTSFLKKFCFVKIISDYQNKNDDIINSFNTITIRNILSFIDMNDLLKNLNENEIKINDLINELPKTFNSNEVFYQFLSTTLNFDKTLNSIIENTKKYNNVINNEITYELIIQFSPIKFSFITLNNNIFDFIFQHLFKKCNICKKSEKHSIVCLICGEKICENKQEIKYNLFSHLGSCTADMFILIDINTSKLYYVDAREKNLKKLYYLYVDKTGSGPENKDITNEFQLSHEKLKCTLKNYVSNDFHFK